MTENYVKLFVIINNKKNYEYIKKMMIDRAIRNSRLINKMKITLFIELINEFINFINLIQARSRKARDTFISKINSILKSRRFYYSNHFFLIFNNFSKTKINLFKTRDKLIRQMQFIIKFKSHYFFTICIATLIVDFSMKHVKMNNKLFVIETKLFITMITFIK